ncbi:uncharacterized protein I303_102339 [Kwoniella dejecticola CBS 10117]|uniref:Uncharacterized protein n=1 Tax=Kwoniella dejecticola CBS 10117 TaxID=1296121 RepID=A0A1A6AB93_9TREE|nr:uncharacterized protein I303_01520 [Kwoniella dejecticola CBS 10117]OBR87318.1 hypothetical protein I303_01520 [Kwoniella dejecticola CBS 10117]
MPSAQNIPFNDLSIGSPISLPTLHDYITRLSKDLTPESFAIMGPVHHLVLTQLQIMVPRKIVRLSREISESTLSIMFRHMVFDIAGHPFSIPGRSNSKYLLRNMNKIQSLHIKEWTAVRIILNYGLPSISSAQSRAVEGQFSNVHVSSHPSELLTTLKHLHLDHETARTLHRGYLNDGTKNFFRYLRPTQSVTIDVTGEYVTSIDRFPDLLSGSKEPPTQISEDTIDPDQNHPLRIIRCPVSSDKRTWIPKLAHPCIIVFAPTEKDPVQTMSPGVLIDILWSNVYYHKAQSPAINILENVKVGVPHLKTMLRDLRSIKASGGLPNRVEAWCDTLDLKSLFVEISQYECTIGVFNLRRLDNITMIPISPRDCSLVMLLRNVSQMHTRLEAGVVEE